MPYLIEMHRKIGVSIKLLVRWRKNKTWVAKVLTGLAFAMIVISLLLYLVW